MKCHLVYNVSLPEPTASDPLQVQKQPPPPPIIVRKEIEHEVAEILDTKDKKKMCNIMWDRLVIILQYLNLLTCLRIHKS